MGEEEEFPQPTGELSGDPGGSTQETTKATTATGEEKPGYTWPPTQEQMATNKPDTNKGMV